MALYLSGGLGLQLENVKGYTTCTNLSRCRCNKDMTIVNCRNRGLTSIPDIPATALTLDLSGNNITTIPTQAFSKLSKLRSLDLTGIKLRIVEPLAFEGLESLTKLDLSLNDIDTIPTQQFSKLSKLKSLDLLGNKIRIIEPFAFEGLESLTTIDLSSNDIDTIPTQQFSKLSNLQSLKMNHNQIHLVESFAFYGLQNIAMLNLNQNKIKTLSRKSFANIPRLNVLYLSENRIQTIAADAFTGTANISIIDLDFNALSEIPSIGSQPRLSIIELSFNQFVNATFPSSYKNRYNNLYIFMRGNKIETLDRFTFSSLAGATIKEMRLTFNNISSVRSGTFDTLASIETLDLSDNPLSMEAYKNVADSCNRKQVTLGFNRQESLINGISAFMMLGIRLGICASFSSGNVFKEFQNLTIIRLTKDGLHQFSEVDFPGKKNVLAMDLAENDFSSFPKCLPTSLESLDLRGNKISLLFQNEISSLRSLKTLLLARNSIVHLRPGAFNDLRNLRVLDLAQNKIGTVSRDIFEPLQNLKHLYLGKNRFNDLIKLSGPLSSLRVLDLSENGCERIEKPFSESFPSLQILHLEGNNLGEFVFQSDRGSRMFKGLTDLKKVFISRNNIRKLPDLIFHDQVYLKFLDISKNRISGWGPNVFQLTRNIAKLNISSNRISVLTESNLHYLKNLKELYLTNNQFFCSCDLLWFREWIDRTSVALPDKESYTCHGPDEWRGKPLLEFTKNKINCTFISKYVIVGSVSGALLVSAATVILVFRNRWRLRLRLYLLSKHGRQFLRYERGHAQQPNYGTIKEDGRQDHYDAYISCSDRDYDWALHNLLPGIDNGRYDDDMFGGDFKLFFDPRDKEPGNVCILQNYVMV